MDKVSRGPRDNGTNGQRVISSTQGQGLLKKNGQFELVSEEGPSCYNNDKQYFPSPAVVGVRSMTIVGSNSRLLPLVYPSLICFAPMDGLTSSSHICTSSVLRSIKSFN